MATYLLTWNPNRWLWTEEEIQEDIQELERLGPDKFERVVGFGWSCGTNYKRINPGDRLL